MQKLISITLNLVPILLMIGLIPLVSNDYLLTLIYLAIISIALLIKYEKKEYILLIFGITGMFVFETIFISTKVETFNRNSLFGLMPLWLPFLWGYSFIVIKRSLKILEN